MGNPENLISLGSRTTEEQRKIATKGGLVRSDAKKLAARIRELKKKGLTNENAQRIVDLIEGKQANSIEIYNLLMGMNAKTDKEKKTVAELLIKASDHQHPKAVGTTNVNIGDTNIIMMSSQEVEARAKQIIIDAEEIVDE